MYKIGAFSKIGQVSVRLLRYYDQIGLLKPCHTDPWTGYRFYAAEQLTDLNRILALRELGLSLEEIQSLLAAGVDPEALRGLFLKRKRALEQSIRADVMRLQQLQLRLQQLDNDQAPSVPDVVIKTMPAQPILSFRDPYMPMTRWFALFQTMGRLLPEEPTLRRKYGLIHTVLYTDVFDPEGVMDLAIGFLLVAHDVAPMVIDEQVTLIPAALPAVETMATIIHKGSSLCAATRPGTQPQHGSVRRPDAVSQPALGRNLRNLGRRVWRHRPAGAGARGLDPATL